MSLYANAVQSLLQPDFVIGANIFPYQATRIAVRNGGIIEISMYVISKNVFRVVFLANDRCTRQSYFHSIAVAGYKIFQETSIRTIIAVRLINKVDALHRDIIGVLW